MHIIEKARARVMVHHPFYGSCIAATPLVICDVPTAQTDHRKIYFGREFAERLTSAEVEFVFAHEVMHIVLMHALRRGGRHPVLWNVACDYVINAILIRAKFQMPAGINEGLYDRRFENMCEEEVYDILYEEAMSEPQPGGNDGKSDGSGDDSSDGNGSGGSGPDQPDTGPARGGGEGRLSERARKLMEKAGALANDMTTEEITDPVEKAKIEQEARQTAAQAATVARQCGRYSADLRRLVDRAMKPQVPWDQVLREYMTEFAANDETWSRRNRRLRGVFLPSMRSEAMGEIIIVCDTSGSVSDKEIAQVISEIAYMAEVIEPERIRIVWADDMDGVEQVFERGENVVCDPVGGGGTDMCKPLRKIEEYNPIVAVLATDGYTPWPEETPYPLIVCCSTDAPVPIGRVIRMRDYD